MSELRAQAEAQGKALTQVAEETLRAGLKERSRQDLVAYGWERGRDSDIPEEQVPEIIKQWRRERHGR